MTPEDFELAMQAHFWGPLNTILAVLPSMRAKKSGRIVNISSIGGKVSVPHLVPYSACKFVCLCVCPLWLCVKPTSLQRNSTNS